MNTPNKVLMAEARETLRGKWKVAVKVTALYFIISLVLRFIPIVGSIGSFIISGPFMLGFAMFYLSFSRGESPQYTRMFEGFHTWTRALGAYLLKNLYVLLWSLLLIIPGIIAVFSYSQTFYILAEDKTISVNDAIDKSKAMMKGHKWKLFGLQCRFIGWALLSVLTMGIGLLWLVPYVQVSLAKFYDDIKGVKPAEPTIVSGIPSAI